MEREGGLERKLQTHVNVVNSPAALVCTANVDSTRTIAAMRPPFMSI